jgi:hypothetical protein
MKEKKLQNQSKKSFEDYISKQNKSDLFCSGKVFYKNGTVGTTYHNDSGLIGVWTATHCYIVPEFLYKRSSSEKKSTIDSLNRAQAK